jgi:hypothetical protein
MSGLWRWVVLIVAIVSVGLALLREQNRSSDVDATEASTNTNSATPAEPLGTPTPAPEWCIELQDIDESTPLNDVAIKYLSAGLIAGGAIERDLTAAALAMTGKPSESTTSAAVSTTTYADNVDAEGRYVDEDPLLRAGQLIEEKCKRVSLQAAPSATNPQ